MSRHEDHPRSKRTSATPGCGTGSSSRSLTDQDGLFGWGEATLEWHTRAVVGAIEDLAELLVGEDPTRIEHLWQMMYRQHFWHGHGIVRATAIAGIDLALWDILGKVARRAVLEALGRAGARLRPHLLPPRRRARWRTSTRRRPRTPKRFADLARQAVADGFTAFKSMAVPPTLPLEGLKPIRAAEACVAAMREAVGDAIDIMVDCHARPSPAMGLQFAKALEPYGLYFLEEPCWPESVDGLAMINAAVSHADRHRRARDEPRRVPRPVRRPGLRGLPARHHALRRLHAKPGGSRRWPRRTASRWRRTTRRGRSAPPRRWSSASRSRATSSARRSTPTCPGGRTWCRKASRSRRKGRIVRPNTRPGLGIAINEAEVKKHPFQQELLQRVFYPDGSVGDW